MIRHMTQSLITTTQPWESECKITDQDMAKVSAIENLLTDNNALSKTTTCPNIHF